MWNPSQRIPVPSESLWVYCGSRSRSRQATELVLKHEFEHCLNETMIPGRTHRRILLCTERESLDCYGRLLKLSISASKAHTREHVDRHLGGLQPVKKSVGRSADCLPTFRTDVPIDNSRSMRSSSKRSTETGGEMESLMDAASHSIRRLERYSALEVRLVLSLASCRTGRMPG